MSQSRYYTLASCPKTASLNFFMPQCTKVQQIFNALFRLVKPTIQSLQSTTSDCPVNAFLKNENLALTPPKDQVWMLLSATQQREPPVPFRSSLVKLMSIEFALYRMSREGRNFSQIQVDPKKAASMFIHILCFLQRAIARADISMAALKVLPQLKPNQKGISPFCTSSYTICSKASTSSQKLRISGLYTQGTGLLQKMSLIVSPFYELTWLPCPKQPTNLSTSGLFPSMLRSFIFLYLAACTLPKIDSVAELFIMPPPAFFRRNFSGSPKTCAHQSTTMFYSYVNAGDATNEKLGVWLITENISANTFVTFI